MELIMGPWPWYVGGGIVALVMIALILLGRSFGFSSNFRNICSALGAGNTCNFFDFDWRKQKWNLLFLVGAVIGGFLSAHFLSNNQVPQISAATIAKLNELGFESAGKEYVPSEIFKTMNLKNIILLSVGGLLIGFGTRYAGGCTSGHAISGLSDLQLPSLIAVIGFFIGGLLMVHVFFPFIF
ncbi:YeeE/YedE family protein [Sphingobacterium daejeonense]|uniref:YeeE/YedE family protein n=1 Tax=Sphingobacterium daejeonense TaxID=371142 RepID=UPI0021A86BD0|nr:YeeE/YedE family protein [Sphingobacterium daejeonense]MCT1532793.1 YeeE/YedE family protein [Sphingobacterium daejeonense]